MLHEEPSEAQRKEFAAYYTSEDVAFAFAREALALVPQVDRPLKILEPSAGNGAFLEPIIAALGTRPAEITLIEIDPRAVTRLVDRLRRLVLPNDISVRVITANFFEFVHEHRWDLVIGNPPFGRKLGKGRASQYKVREVSGQFLEALLPLTDVLAMIVPKYFLHNAEYRGLRASIANQGGIPFVWDLGEDAFAEANIETIAITVTAAKNATHTRVISKSMGVSVETPTDKVADPNLPSWLLYRDSRFDDILAAGTFGLFTPVRDRYISSRHHQTSGVPLIRAKNIAHGVIGQEAKAYVDSSLVPESFWKRVQTSQPVVVPNLSYYPRAALLPVGHYTDGSAAMLFPTGAGKVSYRDLVQYSSEEFFWFYRIARNYSVRSLNVDSTAAYYFGVDLPDLGNKLVRDTRKLRQLRPS